MTSEIETYLDQLLSIRQDVPGIVAGLTDRQFTSRPAPGQWSVGECLAHLNVIGEAYMPVLDAVIAKGRAAGLKAQGSFAYGWLERWFVRGLEPPPRRRFKARAKFTPGGDLSVDTVVRRFMALQDAIGERLRNADGLDLKKLKVRSQVAPISFTLGSTFAILLAHERRHVWQAREARKQLEYQAA